MGVEKLRRPVSTPSANNRGTLLTINSQSIRVYEKDADGKITYATGTAAATTQDSQSDYAKSAVYVKTDVATGTSGTYQNVGTAASSSFKLVEGVEAVITAVTAGDGLSGGGTEGAVSLAVTVDDDTVEINADTVRVKANGIGANELLGSNELVSVGLMGTVAAFGFPFNVTTDTEQAAALAKVEDGGVFANLAVSSGEAGYAANYQLFPDTEVENDAAYFGAAAPFGVLTFNVSATVAVYGADSITWEYWNGSAWSALTIVYDETDTTAQDGLRPFQQDGQIIFSAPTDWASTTVDSQAAYWVRARCNATVNITTIPLLDSQEHKLVTSPTASEMPNAGTIGRARISFDTVSGANNDTIIILCNLTKGTCSALTTLTQALSANEVANFAVTCDAGDQIVVYVTQEDGTTEFANGLMELLVAKA